MIKYLGSYFPSQIPSTLKAIDIPVAGTMVICRTEFRVFHFTLTWLCLITEGSLILQNMSNAWKTIWCLEQMKNILVSFPAKQWTAALWQQQRQVKHFPPGPKAPDPQSSLPFRSLGLLGGNRGDFLKTRDKNATEHQRALQLLCCNHGAVHINFTVFITPETTKLSEEHLEYNLRKGAIAITLSWQTWSFLELFFTSGKVNSSAQNTFQLHSMILMGPFQFSTFCDSGICSKIIFILLQ